MKSVNIRLLVQKRMAAREASQRIARPAIAGMTQGFSIKLRVSSLESRIFLENQMVY
jgi:hypothetical protein